ncbi:M23 family metallopeptidase [Microbacterium esteraromaticum]|uniref:murein hydrolase activator EnvC family protein n=1 Tax=Microbacterium esteraromaticum TaxID=57043 RepID=UPI0023684E60|nr:M23 family metallopeptidase [Microbacterium esteraromaticum]WDH80129.1 M23 family metallopeptidase [Microbacterium esteraromaticum]
MRSSALVPHSIRRSPVRAPVRWQRRAADGRMLLLVRVALIGALLGLGCLGTVRADAVVADAARVADATGSADTDVDAPGFPWRWPVGGARRVVEPFRAPAHDYGPGHRGMDIAVVPGADVHAPAGGVVAFRGTVVDRPLVTIDHGSGFVSTWEPVSSSLAPGDVVTAGAVIGAVAEGGHTVRGAMHIGVRVDGEYVNPLPLFGQVPRAVLLPCCSAVP